MLVGFLGFWVWTSFLLVGQSLQFYTLYIYIYAHTHTHIRVCHVWRAPFGLILKGHHREHHNLRVPKELHRPTVRIESPIRDLPGTQTCVLSAGFCLEPCLQRWGHDSFLLGNDLILKRLMERIFGLGQSNSNLVSELGR